jgi:hypothetical protein
MFGILDQRYWNSDRHIRDELKNRIQLKDLEISNENSVNPSSASSLSLLDTLLSDIYFKIFILTTLGFFVIGICFIIGNRFINYIKYRIKKTIL